MLPNELREWIDQQRDRMIALVSHWASINSGTSHPAGVAQVAAAVLPEFSTFGVLPRLLAVPAAQEIDNRGRSVAHALGPALSLRIRPQARRRVLLAIHLDTVYGKDSDFQAVRRDERHLYGPGVADAKGGLAVMLVALEALERFVAAHAITDLGWEVLLNPDEEIGSPGSSSMLRAATERNHIGLLFEPALPSGDLAGERKGSANFQIVCRGKSAHAGRHFDEGINAVAAAADIAVRIHALNTRWSRTTLNVARIDGGGPLNIVPDVAILRVNIRYSDRSRETEFADALADMMAHVRETARVECELHGSFTTPPKLVAGGVETLLGQALACGRGLGCELNYFATGGVCDGNRLAGWGLPNVDTLGPRGGGIHSRDEFLVLDSLTERAKLTASLLIGWAAGTIPWPLDTPANSKET